MCFCSNPDGCNGGSPAAAWSWVKQHGLVSGKQQKFTGSGTDPDHGLRQHNVDGTPMINVDKFPDLKGLVDYGHSKGVLMGWYLNGCACGEREERKVNYEGDVKLLDAFGFDAVKLDGCGAATT